MRNSNVRLGAILRCDNGGLGAESWEFSRHLLDEKDKVMLLRGEHGHFPERYQGLNITPFDHLPSDSDLAAFLRDIDVLFTIETFYNWNAIPMARERNIKTVLRINYEFLPDPRHELATLNLSPSTYYFDNIPGNKKLLPFPVNRQVLPFRQRTKVDTFYHVAGHELYEDRNGTEIFLQAIRFMKNKPTINLFSQHDLSKEALAHYIKDSPNVHCFTEAENYWDIHTGDCLVLPRRYGGQSLQMNEALSTGAIVLTTDCKPQNEFLPPATLIQPSTTRKIQAHGAVVDCYDVDPQRLAIKMDELAEMDITELSEVSDRYATSISWDRLAPEYIRMFEGV